MKTRRSIAKKYPMKLISNAVGA